MHAGLPGGENYEDLKMTDSGVDYAAAKQEIIGYAKKGGALVAGVADVEDFTRSATISHPDELLPNAKRVVVLGGARPRAGDWESPAPELMSTMGTSDRIHSLALKVAKFIESRFGHYALFVPTSKDIGNRPFMNVAEAAVLAGCGNTSLAGPVLSNEFGFLYYSALVTTLPLPSDPIEEPPACPAPECVTMYEESQTTPCMKVCPIDDGGCLGGRIDAEGVFKDRRFNQARCETRVHTHWVPGFQKVLEEALNEEDREKRKMILYGSYFTRTLWSITYANQNQNQCFECMRVCPASRVMGSHQ